MLAITFVAVMGCGENPSECAGGPGTICTWAGVGDPAFDGDGRHRLATALYWPTDLEFAPDGRAYILDWQNHRVRRVGENGRFETVMGTDIPGDGPPDFSDMTAPGAPGTTVALNHPTDIQFLPDGQMLLAAWHNHKIRRLDPVTGLVVVDCGSGAGFAGDGGPADKARLNQVKGIAIDRDGNVIVADARNQRIRRIAADGDHTISTVAGTGEAGFSGDGGPPLAAQLRMQTGVENPEPGGGVAVDDLGRIFVPDTENHRIRMIDLEADVITTVAGTGAAGFSGDGGRAAEAQLNYPRDVEVGPDRRLYIADDRNHRIRAVDLETGIIATVAGVGERGFSGDGGPAVAARLFRPFGVAFDAAGNIYIADTFNNRIRRIAR